MTRPEDRTDVKTTPGGPLAALARRRKAFAYALLLVALLFAVLAVGVFYRYKTDFWVVPAWAGLMSLVALGGGLWQLLDDPADEVRRLDSTRKTLLAVGGMFGVLSTLMAVLLGWLYYSGAVTGGLQVWRQEWWRLAILLSSLFGGLIVMFLSVQLARSDERSSAGMRRLVYGYNALLGALLLVNVLIVLNILAYVNQPPFKFFGTTFDWTPSAIHTLDPASVAVLEKLEKPVQIYVLLNNSDWLLFRSIETLMSNCQSVNKHFEAEFLSPDQNRNAIAALRAKYPVISDRAGVLIVYGAEGTSQQEFIPRDKLVDDRSTGERERIVFKGEDELMKAIVYLSQEKSKTVVYFTQGQGELKLTDFAPDSEDGASTLKDKMERSNYEAKELKLGVGGEEKVPDDAGAVVVAGPRRALSKQALDALRAYLNPAEGKKKGKLVVLFEVTTDPATHAMVQTGLEPLLTEYGVRVGNDRVLNANETNSPVPNVVPVIANPGSRNPVASAFDFRRGFNFRFDDARTVRVLPPAEGGAARPNAQVLMIVWPFDPAWAETDLAANPGTLVADLRKPGREEDLNRKIQPDPSREPDPLSVAVVVSEGGQPPPMMPGHPPLGPRDEQPRMVVFGDATWVSNRALNGRGRLGADLFVSSLSWLRERPDIGKIADHKERQDFTFNPSPATMTRLYWVPAEVMVLAIVLLAGGIWVARRR